MRGPLPKLQESAQQPPSRQESLAAWERNKDKIESMARSIIHPGNWTREEWIAHWLKIEASPASLYAARCANEALHNLGHR